MKKIKVFLMIPSLGGGGAEKVMITLLKHLDKKKFQSTLVSIAGQGPYLSLLPQNASYINLNSKKVRYALPKLLKLINDEKPDIVFSTLRHLNVYILLFSFFFPKQTKIVVRESNTVSHSLEYSSHKRIHTMLLKRAYPRSDLIICQSKGVANDLIDNFGIKASLIEQIYNPVDLDYIDRMSGEKTIDWPFANGQKIIIAMGKLTKQKGFEYLIKAFAIVSEQYPTIKMSILGTGPDEQKLKNLARELEVYDKIFFAGFQINPYAYLKNSGFFVLSSLWEGFPNALLEAMACGLPVISTDCPSGPSEIIEQGKNGLLVPTANEDALAKAIIEIIDNDTLRNQLARESRKTIMNFIPEKIVREYEKIFASIMTF